MFIWYKICIPYSLSSYGQVALKGRSVSHEASASAELPAVNIWVSVCINVSDIHHSPALLQQTHFVSLYSST